MLTSKQNKQRKREQTIGIVRALREAGLLRMAALDFALPSTKT
jgi:hypothetical protein